MMTLNRTNSANADLRELIIALDRELAARNGETNDFFTQFNKTDMIHNVVVAYNGQLPVGCGAMKRYDGSAMEIKRMFVPLAFRGKGIAALILGELENWAKELGYTRCILETGEKMPEAIRCYHKSGYQVIPNYGPYENVEGSICFEKEL